MAAGTPEVGDRDDHVGLGRRLARELRAHLLAQVVDVAAADDGVGPGEVDVLEDAGPRRALGKGRWLSTPSAVMVTISPFSISRTNSAPTMSSAQVSDAST